MKSKLILLLIISLLFPTSLFASSYEGKKILYINSYHTNYPWSDGITAGIHRILKGTNVDLKTIMTGE